jgi:hypothetical protein
VTSPAAERRLLQGVILVCALVPVGGGLWGALGHMDTAGSTSASHARYLSGLLLGIGLTFWACVPTIERQGVIVRALATLVVIGGLARLVGAFQMGFSGGIDQALVMELAVTPLIAFWRERVERRLRAT